jgi:hypothetical protein
VISTKKESAVSALFKLHYAAVVALAVTLTACAATPSAELSAEDAATRDQINALIAENPDAEITVESEDREQRLVCRRERVLGSNIPQRVCFDPRAVADAADNARQTQRGLARGSTGPRDPMAADRAMGEVPN